jgi:hypothetical protein
MSAYFMLLYVQSAQAICKLSEVLGDSLSSHQEVLLQSLMKEIPGRLWEVNKKTSLSSTTTLKFLTLQERLSSKFNCRRNVLTAYNREKMCYC